MQYLKRYAMFVALIGFVVFVLNSCAGLPSGFVKNEPPHVAEGSQAVGAVGNVVNLDQGWSEAVQERWYFTSQGSQIISYDWFLHIEQATNTDPFRSNANITRLRYLPQNPTGQNPDGLPVGFAKDVNDVKNYGEPPGEWLGLTCAACHTSQIEFNGQAIRIEGAGALADFNTFFEELVESLEATLNDQAKFVRFANNVGTSQDTLRAQLTRRTAFLRSRLDINRPPSPAGYSRLDAVAQIFNAVWGQDLNAPPPNDVNRPPNTSPANAPVSYPAIWDAPHMDLVQWTGFVDNKPPGAVIRNLTEVLGVFADFSFHEDEPFAWYNSSVRIAKQSWLEEWLTNLWSPRWPADSLLLPAIDMVKAARGKDLYLTNCTPCHAVMKNTRDPKRKIATQMWSLPFIGTDPLNAETVGRLSGIIKTGKIKDRIANYIEGPPLGPDTTGRQVLVHGVIGILGRKPLESIVSVVASAKTALLEASPFDPMSYRARPLNGIWATAPFLHNGSVPSLWELLKPSAQRVTTFNVGNRGFDPVNVGYVTTVPPDGNATLFDTTLPGNSNAGHNYGGALSDADKRALIEYIKSL